MKLVEIKPFNGPLWQMAYTDWRLLLLSICAAAH